MNNSIAELAIMRARGELTAEEFAAAKALLQSGAAPSTEPEASIAMPGSIKTAFARYPASERGYENRPKATSSAKSIFFLLLVAGVVFIWMSGSREPKTSGVIKNEVVAPGKSAEDKRKGFHCLSLWDGSYRPLVDTVTKKLRDPDSFEHIETRISPISPSGLHSLVMQYRARNGFGGMNVEQASAQVRNVDCAMMNAVTGVD
jgi:hypothetical protein